MWQIVYGSGWQPVISMFFTASVLFSGNFFRFFTIFTCFLYNTAEYLFVL
jgi:hypothetical protein